MNNVYWHKLSEHDYPHVYKPVLMLTDNGNYTMVFYHGEALMPTPWFSYFMHENVTGDHFVAWCELPPVPKDLIQEGIL